MRELVVDVNNEGQRIDKFLLKYLSKMPKSFLYKMLRKKNIKLNDEKILGSEILKQGDKINIFMTDETLSNFGESSYVTYDEETVEEDKKSKNRKVQLDIVFEDENMIIVNKPANMLVYSDEDNHDEKTLLSEVIRYLEYNKDQSYIESRRVNFMPAVCNRLDRNTMGLVIIGKNFKTVKHINEMIKNHFITKSYIAVVYGRVKKEKERIIKYWDKDEENNEATISDIPYEGWKEIITEYEVVGKGSETTLLKVNLVTGKSHQIRATLADIGYPIIGDMKYGLPDVNSEYRKKFNVTSQLLCAYELIIDGRKFEIDCDFKKYLV